MTISYLSRLVSAGALLLGVPPTAVHARTTFRDSAHCNRIATTSFTFGLTGGNIRPSALRIAANGTVSPAGDTTGIAYRSTVPTRILRTLARHAWTGAFAKLPAAPTQFKGMHDVARKYVELRSACGTKYVESESGYEAPAFREIYSRLESVTRPH
ncbi:MAG: hypothetical protein M3Z10_02230 [Gemmatimonadota bacterium]|nr:hypothetical protein [Gemmatimonadota bacterium]